MPLNDVWPGDFSCPWCVRSSKPTNTAEAQWRFLIGIVRDVIGAITMTTQFDFHLLGAEAPAGELDADALLALVGSLKEVATKIARVETDADEQGRIPKRTSQVSRLTIGLGKGSTVVHMHRSGVIGGLDFSVPEEQAFDERFSSLVRSLADEFRPEWVSDSLAAATRNLAAALRSAAPAVEFKADGGEVCEFKTSEVDLSVWGAVLSVRPESMHFTGRLYAANRNTHRYSLEDAVGHQISLPRVEDDAELGQLLDKTVVATGAPQFGRDGQVSSLEDAVVVAVADDLDLSGVDSVVGAEEILASAPGPDFDGGIALSEEEANAYLEAALG